MNLSPWHGPFGVFLKRVTMVGEVGGGVVWISTSSDYVSN